MMSTFNIILLCYFFVYIIQCIIYIRWFIQEHERDISFILFSFLPFISTIVVFAPAVINMIYHNISDKRIDLKDMKLSSKERKIKIKKGIIRVSELDPFGEENWNN